MTMSLECFFVAAAVLYALYYYFTMTFNFWKVRGIPGPKPVPVFGSGYRYMIGKLSTAEFFKELYDKYKDEPMVGLFLVRTPSLIIQDPDLIKDVLIKDFPKFMDRPFPSPEIAEPLTANLFGLDAKRWKPMRAQLTPVFTTGKLKGMFSLILECTIKLESYLDTLILQGGPIDVREVTSRYATDVITSCAFGIEANSMSDKESDFRRLGREIFQTSPMAIVKNRMKEYCLEFYDLLGYVTPRDKVTEFLVDVITQTMECRKKTNIFRPDFLNALLDLEKHPEKLGLTKLTKEYLTAQAFVFFVAGFETSASSISNTLYELALNPVIQEKLRHEILKCGAKNNGEWTYETVNGIEYLDKVLHETLRKYPPVIVLRRRASEDYTFKNPNIWIPKGTRLWIPVYAIHHDPNIFPNPGVYDPDRFNADLVKTRHPMNYIPFGAGPRNCIGARFGFYQTKIGLIKIISRCKFETCAKTPCDPYEQNRFSLPLRPKEALYLKVTKLKN